MAYYVPGSAIQWTDRATKSKGKINVKSSLFSKFEAFDQYVVNILFVIFRNPGETLVGRKCKVIYKGESLVSSPSYIVSIHYINCHV